MGWPSAAMLLLVVALLCIAARGPLAAEAAATKQPAKFESTRTTTALPASTAAKLRAAPTDDDGKNDVQDRPVTSGVELEDYDDAADELPSTDLKARTGGSATPAEGSDDDDEDDDYDSTDDFEDAEAGPTEPSESTTSSTPTTAKAASATAAAEENAVTKSSEPMPQATANLTNVSTVPTSQASTTNASASSVPATTTTTTTTAATSPTGRVTTTTVPSGASTVSVTSTEGSTTLKDDATTNVESTTSLADSTISVRSTTENPDVSTAVNDGSDVTVKPEIEPEFSGDNQIAAYQGAASSLSVTAVESTTSSTTTTESSTTESTTTESTTTASTTTESTTTESTTTELTTQSTTTESMTAEGTTTETTTTETSTMESSSDEVSTNAESTTESDSTTSSEMTTTVSEAEGSAASGMREMEDLDAAGGTTTQSTPEITTVRDYEPDLNAVINQFMTQILPLTTRFLSDTNVSADCVNHLWKVYQGFRRQDAWALRLITSSGLIPANLFEGSLSNLGSYEQCLRTKSVGSEGELEIQGRYCSLFFRPPPLYYNRTTEQFKAIGEMQHECRTRIEVLFVQEYGARAIVKNCRVEEPFTMSDLQIGILCALGGSVGLVLLATLVEICLFCCSNHKVSDPKYDVVPVKVVKCFSLVHNTRRLISTHFDTNCPRKPVRFVYGVKVFMMLWIILGHSYYTSNFQTLHSGYRIMDLYSMVHAQLLGSAFYAVSTFFFMSGFVLAYFMRQSKDETIMRPFLALYVFAVVRRYLKLTIPAMVVVLCFFLFPLFISGPQDQDLMGQEQEGCNENWWTIMAQIVNFVPSEKRCMQQYWYISSDMQIFLVAVPMSIIFVRSPACGFSLALLLSVLASVAAGLVTYMKDLKPSIAFTIDDFSRNLETAEFVHELPYSNLATYFMGILSGYCAATWSKACINKVLQAFLWILALCLNVFLVFVPYAWNRCETDDLKQLYAAFYGGSYRYLWGLSWCWIAYACATGRGGILSRFLSWNPFVVLGRLTFGVYLIQYVVFIARQGVSTNTLQVNEFLQVKDSLGVAVISYFFAYLLHVVYEAPVAGVTRMIFQFHKIRKPGGGSKKRPQQPQPESPPPAATTSEPTSNGSAATPMASNDSNHTPATIPEEP
ncbi:nose resistant to fluoxetine protein 6-like [Dermacentor silvarum]|uniref:nose resistant to fluoxetine protein 6-like n=1 Tax=Dermacentor silvarum TaxID=543639 RepID=UPI002101096D|nr:nose resistant to fluoxetine protein 6-like [Dermacentor silvarum]